jgi:hypothetical protein
MPYRGEPAKVERKERKPLDTFVNTGLLLFGWFVAQAIVLGLLGRWNMVLITLGAFFAQIFCLVTARKLLVSREER